MDYSRRGITKRDFLAHEDHPNIPILSEVLSPLIDRRVYVTICNSTRQRRRDG